MTITPSHTPGPWRIMPLGTVIYAPSKVGPNVTICTGTMPDNARLIAAAPELFKALIKCRGIAFANDGGLGPLEEDKFFKEMQSIVDVASKALDKATGKPHKEGQGELNHERSLYGNA